MLASAAINKVQLPPFSAQCSKICKFGKKSKRKANEIGRHQLNACLTFQHCHWATAIFNRSNRAAATFSTNFHQSLDFRCKNRAVGGKYNQHIQLCRDQSWIKSSSSENDFFEYFIKVSEVNLFYKIGQLIKKFCATASWELIVFWTTTNKCRIQGIQGFPIVCKEILDSW